MVNRHEMIDLRSLAFGKLIAKKLRADPSLIQLAQENLDRWLQASSPRGVSTLEEWREVLEGPIEGVIELLTSFNERAIRLRQSNPFAGALTNQERNEILLAFENYDPSST